MATLRRVPEAAQVELVRITNADANRMGITTVFIPGASRTAAAVGAGAAGRRARRAPTWRSAWIRARHTGAPAEFAKRIDALERTAATPGA